MLVIPLQNARSEGLLHVIPTKEELRDDATYEYSANKV